MKLRPTTEDALCEAIGDARRDDARLVLAGGGSKAGFGAPIGDARVIDMTGFASVVDYDPAELVLTARPGTPLAEIEALVRGEGQMLAFAPFDHGPIYGRAAGAATIGGVVAAGVAGSQRVSCGGARDHLLGFRAVSGRGEPFVAGAKVVKNVTGFDLSKLIAGSWGRLVALTEITLKVLPRPRVSATRIVEGLDVGQAIAAMAAAMGSQAEVAAAAHVPGAPGGGRARTIVRIQGFGPSVVARAAMLDVLLAGYGPVHAPDETEAADLWSDLATLRRLPGDRALWRVNVPPSAGQAIVATIEPLGADWLFDWAGGLVWIALDGHAGILRDAAIGGGGHATLVRAPAEVRALVPALHPALPGVAALEARIRRAFDPDGVFETGRF